MEPETERTYESLTTDQLHEMRVAFEQDKADGGDSDFCTGRLELIARVLATRKED